MKLYLLLFTIFTTALNVSGDGQKRKCGEPTDLVFILDSSTSIWIVDFEKELDFLKKVVSKFEVKPEKTRIGAVSFSEGIKQEFELDTYNTKREVMDALGNIPMMNRYRTETFLGLKFAREVMFQKARSNVPKVAIVLTDGNSSDAARTAEEAEKLRAGGVHVFVIGIGEKVFTPELQAIASSPPTDYVIKVDSFDKLGKSKELSVLSACNECKRNPVDIVFVLDSSSSIYTEDFDKQVQFVRNFVSKFDVGPEQAQVSVVSFSDNATVEFYLNSFPTKDEVEKALDQIEYTGGDTYTKKALKKVVQEVLITKNGYRKSVPNVVIVITDGMTAEPDSTIDIATKLKRMENTFVFTIGIGMDTNTNELEAIASSPSEDFTYFVNSYEGLDEMNTGKLIAKTCEVIEPPPALP